MKRLLLFGLAVLLYAGCQAKHYPTASLYARDQDRMEFQDAFVTEPACSGLKLVKDTSGADVRIHYNGTSFTNPKVPIHQVVTGFIAYPHSLPDFSGDTPALAVKQACDILKGKGGSVE